MEIIIDRRNNKELFNLVMFALKAKGQEGFSQYLIWYICINKGVLRCTDGHRMHVIEHAQLKFYKTGLYDLIQNKNGQIIINQYSDSIDLWPEFKKIEGFHDRNERELTKIVKDQPRVDFNIFVSQVIRELDKGDCINIQFLKDAYPFVDHFRPGEKRECVYFEGPNVKAYIMTMIAE